MGERARNPKFVWQDAFSERGPKGTAGHVGLLMSLRDNGDGRGFWITQERLAALAGVSTRTVRNHLNTLVETGWIVVTQRGGNHGGKAHATTYRLAIPAPAQAEADFRVATCATDAQPEDSCILNRKPGVPQPETTFHPVDRDSVDPSPVDHSFPRGRASEGEESLTRFGRRTSFNRQASPWDEDEGEIPSPPKRPYRPAWSRD